ncbi:hypothetical protein M408DRAFT_21475 [Serendipita vermifera MAFF 305830]|uniref:RNA exonuclease 4 n=1 Tax=Serendipita vermifera MAFF 305830 TaxID=933852 RepID=A0A0C3B3N3_SERVB|nr:hypothetical protein M408DRAFT_21475 [Serendipita vermifera MAFF 305830]
MKTLSTAHGEDASRPTKRRRIAQQHATKSTRNDRNISTASTLTNVSAQKATVPSSDSTTHKIVGDPDSKENLAAMVLRKSSGKENAKPTKFLAMDCEMVGVGPFGLESVLARVTMVNYVGDVVLDEFVLPQETVTDWRTAVSGVRKEDMANAKTFAEVQALVSALLKDRVLVGHALTNDLSALLLSHPWLQTRDTQGFAPFRAIMKSRRPALRKLVKEILGITIQEGEHSSVVDARAPMALYRLYRKQWETRGKTQPLEVVQTLPVIPDRPPERSPSPASTNASSISGDSASAKISAKKLPVPTGLEPSKTLTAAPPQKSTASPRSSLKAKKKQGISSGLSVVVTRNHKPKSTLQTGKGSAMAAGEGKRSVKISKTKEGWWKTLGS